MDLSDATAKSPSPLWGGVRGGGKIRNAIAEILAAAMFLSLTFTPASAQQASDVIAPEQASSTKAAQAVTAKTRMVVAANPTAAQAGLDVLRAGGGAADALVAVQAVLGLVEPQSSGLGGGAFLAWYDAASGKLTTFDARETAPAAATPDLFRDADWQATRLLRRRCRRALGRRARSTAAVGDCASPLRPPAMGVAVPAGDHARGTGFRRLAPPGFRDRRRRRPPRRTAFDAPLFLQCRRHATDGRPQAR